MKTDPHQLNNLAGNLAHKDIETKLSQLLERWQKETGDSVPDKLTPDTFHRETGNRVIKEVPRGTMPGATNRADLMNAPGPVK